eukprot:SAG31_NODE_4623_length_3089_cov_13.908027_1_plen_73_part_00
MPVDSSGRHRSARARARTARRISARGEPASHQAATELELLLDGGRIVALRPTQINMTRKLTAGTKNVLFRPH